MDTIMEITAYGKQTSDALKQARDTIETLDGALNAADPESAVSLLKSGDTLPKQIADPLRTAIQITNVTDNALDLTLYPVSDAWGFYTKNYRVPSDTELKTLLKNRGSFSVNDAVYTCSPETKLDLGSIAKGYAADCAVQTLREHGIQSAILSLGGNVQMLGQKPDGSDWVVSIADPQQPDNTVCNLRVGETAVVTSGSYQRCFEQDGKKYHHILDPKTGKPAKSGLLSVTVLYPDGTTADGLSTALFILGADGVKKLYNQHVLSFEAVLITEKREIFYTNGLENRLEQTNEGYQKAALLQ